MKFSLLKSSYEYFIKPLKDVKQEQNPAKSIWLSVLLNFFSITSPNRNEPNRETTKKLLR